MPSIEHEVAVIGLGYVGLHLAVAFGKVLPTVGFDKDGQRIEELRRAHDRNSEVEGDDLRGSKFLRLTDSPDDISAASFYIVAVPTPVDAAKQPDLRYLIEAAHVVGTALSEHNDGHRSLIPLVVVESTVYPGCVEEVFVPALEKVSGLRAGPDFKVGYSPERINPGDPEHRLETIVKVVAGQDRETCERVARAYEMVVPAGIYLAPSIRVAEAAKVIENIQRDLNIALMNELALLFHRLDLDTQEVLATARTKWNFLPFTPGFVGGHCIPVDPYYLTRKAQEVGYHPEMILAGRRINDQMAWYVAQQTIKLLIDAGSPVKGAHVLVLGATFKENVRDTRNSKALDLIGELASHGVDLTLHDPLVDTSRFGYATVDDPFAGEARYDAIVLAVPHREYLAVPWQRFASSLREGGVLVDVRGVLPRQNIENSGVRYWRL